MPAPFELVDRKPLNPNPVADILSVGVHAYGGDPNVASVIGPAGNVFEDFILAVKVRHESITSSRVKTSTSPNLGQLPNFRILTVYPPETTPSRQMSPYAAPQRSTNRTRDNVDEHLPSDVVGMINQIKMRLPPNKMMLVQQQFSGMGLTENTVTSANGRCNEEPDERAFSLWNDDQYESPKDGDHGSPDLWATHWSDSDER